MKQYIVNNLRAGEAQKERSTEKSAENASGIR